MAILAMATSATTQNPIPQTDIDAVGFRPLEWLVIAIARRDSLASIRQPSRLSLALGSLFGSASTPSLADPHLEVIRHAAVLAWHNEAPSDEERSRFSSLGFGPAQERLLAASVARDRRASAAPRRTEELHSA